MAQSTIPSGIIYFSRSYNAFENPSSHFFLQVQDPQALEKLSFNHGLLLFSLHQWVLRELIWESICLDSAQTAMGRAAGYQPAILFQRTREEGC